MKIDELYECFLQCSAVSTDTRKIEPNSLFIALKGDNFDANTFAQEAINKGAAFVIIDNKQYLTDKDKMILVPDSLVALQELAKYHRDILGLPIIALTGSNGKTTTKELINSVLSKKYNTMATVGNLNNHIGVPLTLLTFKDSTDIGIVEMGANHQKEIAFLCEIASPDYGYITNFGKAHLEGFGGFEGVIKGKCELYSFLRENNKTAFLNIDDQLQVQNSHDIAAFTFSRDKKADVIIESIEANPLVKIGFNKTIFQSNLIGIYNANNINVAITIGKYFAVEESEIKYAIEEYLPTNNRSQLIERNTNKIILDAYNANPSSMIAALTNFVQLDSAKKVIVLGDMFELGEESLEEHKNIIDFLESQNLIEVYFIGNDFYANKKEANHFNFFESFDNFSTQFKSLGLQNATILIKGSRGMALERTLDII